MNETSIQYLLKYIWFSDLSKLVEAALAEEGHYVVEDETVPICHTLAGLIQAMLSIVAQNRDVMNYDYESIKNESFKAREQEKQNEFIERIGHLNKFEQKVDKVMRQLKLGNYYVEPNFYKDPDFLEKRQGGVEPVSFTEEGAAVEVSQEDDDDINENSNPLLDEDYNDEDAYGETVWEP
jgi:hypothetical protein